MNIAKMIKGEKMDYYDVVRLGLILSIQAEIEGMKAANVEREHKDESIAYDEDAFAVKAEELRNVSHCRNAQL